MTDRLRALEIFVAVADLGSFARAARQFGASPPAVTRAVASLEERLGVTLLQRTTRSLRLTAAGERFLDHARRVLSELDVAEREAAGTLAEPSGRLAVTVPVTFGRLHVAPVLAALVAAHPRVSAALILVDRFVNLVEEGLDAALRIGLLEDSSLIARRVGETHQVLVGSPFYLELNGTPQSPSDLMRHRLIAFTAQMPGGVWRFERAGRVFRVEAAPRLEVNDALTAIRMAEAGAGLTRVLGYQAADSIAAGRLVCVLKAFQPAAWPIHVVYPAARQASPKLRAFVDLATIMLGATLRKNGR